MRKTSLYIVAGVVVFGLVVVGLAYLFKYVPVDNDGGGGMDISESTEKGIQDVVDANNEFAFDLYTELSKSEKGNPFYSPYSMSAALAITYEGARTETADEMKSVLRFPESNILRPNFAAIYNNINKKNGEYELKTGNALWVQRDHSLLEDYTSTAEKYYGGRTINVDFVKEAERSRQTINGFMEEQTNGKIKDLIPENVLNPLTRLVITNAVYFKGTWKWAFDTKDTDEGSFKTTPTNIIKTPRMYMNPKDEVRFNYAEMDGLQILELPYRGEDVSMLILLPADNLDSVEPSLTAKKLEQYKSQTKETELSYIWLPKFEFDTKYLMKDALVALGMPLAFSQGADFSGMTGGKDLFIDSVIHQAYIKVDEEGTEAAAATAVNMQLTSAGPAEDYPPTFRADHPFMFVIQERETGNILFLGRVVAPSK